jgi:type I restriction enzyme, S subunit
MTPELLLAEFNRISDAPDAISRLRRFVLDLAVRGQLVRQDPNDEPAAELLRRIEAEKNKLTKGTGLKQVTLPPVDPSQLPFEIPRSWEWMRLGWGFKYDAGTKREPRELVPDRWLLELEDIEKDTSTVQTRFKVQNRDSRSTKSEFRAGDILYGKLRPYLNKVVVADEPGYSTTEIVAIRPFIPVSSSYCCLALRRPDFVAYVSRVGRGTKMPRLRTQDALVALFPLPPLAEQHRIVARVNDLMSICDQLEAAKIERESRRHRLAAASFHNLTNGVDTEVFRAQVRFCVGNLDQIAIRPEHIPALRQAILALAVQGKLVKQTPEDDSPESLLSSVREIREKAANRSKTSSVNDSDPKFVQHLPKNLPHRWVSCPLEELFKFIDYRGRTPTRTARGVRLITAKNVRVGYVANDPVEYIDERAYKAWMTRGFPRNGDLLFVTEGATMGFVGTIKLQFEFALAQRTIDLQPYLPSYSRFFLFTLMSPIFQEAVLTNSTGTAVKGIKAAKLKRIRVPLPPLAEQQRIVAKVDELMAVCDRLEAQLTTAQEETGHLLESVLHHVLTVEDAPPVEAQAVAQ